MGTLFETFGIAILDIYIYNGNSHHGQVLVGRYKVRPCEMQTKMVSSTLCTAQETAERKDMLKSAATNSKCAADKVGQCSSIHVEVLEGKRVPNG